MKRYIAFLLIMATTIALVSCKKPGNNDNTSASSAETTESVTHTASEETSAQPADPITGDVLASQEHDLDADGENEYIRIIKNESVHNGVTRFISYLIIGTKEHPDLKVNSFLDTDNEMAGIFSGLEFADLDGDGKDEVFITLQEAASPFTLNNYYVYSYSKDLGYTFTADTKFNMFCESFIFEYTGDGWLKVTHGENSFEASIPIQSGTIISDTVGKKYEQSWVEPVPVDIDADSRTAIVMADGKAKIKVVLPIFGLATSDFIGKIEVFYEMDGDLNQSMTSFAIFGIINQKLEQIAVISIE